MAEGSALTDRAWDDPSLVAAAQGGDVEAFTELVNRHLPKAYNLALRLLGDHADADDALQEALVRVYSNLGRFQGQAAFSTWLYRVVTNACLDEMRRRRRRRVVLQSPQDDALWETAQHAPSPADPGRWLERLEMRDLIEQALDQLNDSYRTVIILRDWQGFSYQEIAVILGCSQPAVKTRIHRARNSLRVLLETQMPEWGHGVAEPVHAAAI